LPYFRLILEKPQLNTAAFLLVFLLDFLTNVDRNSVILDTLR
jgi:hypothetical protein